MRRTAMIIVHRGECISAIRVVEFLARYYSESLPEIDIVIVEQDAHSALEREILPHSCGYRFQFSHGPINRARAFKAGFDIFRGSKDFFLFMDSNLLLTTEDVRANVRKCLEYDFVTSFNRVAELSGEDAEQIMSDDIRWDARSTRNLVTRQSICESCFVITAEGMAIVERWIEASGANITDDPKPFINIGWSWSEENLAAAVTGSLRVFESPNRARRLLSGRGRHIQTRSGQRAACEYR
jgi:hypothetical protein